MLRLPLLSTLFPYTTLFRSVFYSEGVVPARIPQGVEPVLHCRLTNAALARHRSEEHTSELQSRFDIVCRLLLEKKNGTVARKGKLLDREHRFHIVYRCYS